MMKSKYLVHLIVYVKLMFVPPPYRSPRMERKKHQPDPEVKEQQWLASLSGGIPGVGDVEMS